MDQVICPTASSAAHLATKYVRVYLPVHKYIDGDGWEAEWQYDVFSHRAKKRLSRV